MYKLLILIIVNFYFILTYNPLHNINYMYAGFNPKIGQPTIAAIKEPIFNTATYNSNNTIFIQGEYWNYPDNINVIDYPTGKQTIETQIFTTEYNLEQSISETFSSAYKSWFIPGMFSESETANFFHQETELSESYTATTSAIYTVFKATFTNMDFSDNFLSKLNDLGSIYNQNTCKKFYDFFDIYGTHYITSAIYGGSTASSTSFDMNILNEYTIYEINEALKEQFLLMTSETSLNATQKETLENLNIYFKSNFYLIGGYSYEYNISQIQPWIKTIIQEPVFMNMMLVNYTTLLYKNPQNYLALNEAMTEYYYSSYYGLGIINTSPNDIFDGWNKNNFLIGSKIYILANENNYIYDLKLNTFTVFERGPLYNMQGFSCANINTNIYCFFGSKNYNYQRPMINIYDTITESWQSLEVDYCYYNQGSYTCPKINYEYELDLYILGNAIAFDDELIVIFGTGIPIRYTVGGSYEYYYSTPNWYFNITNSMMFTVNTSNWQDLFVPGIAYQEIIKINNDIYLFSPLGVINPYSNVVHLKNYTNLLYKYNIFKDSENINDSWLKLAPMPNTLIKFAVVNKDNYIYVVGGLNVIDNTYNNNVYRYDIDNDSWNILTQSILDTNSLGISFLIDNLYYYFGGSSTNTPYVKNNVQLSSWYNSCQNNTIFYKKKFNNNDLNNNHLMPS